MQRDLALDSFRGLCLAIMTIDHLVLPLSSYTFHALGFISAAEFFVFLSGYIAGIVYTKIRVNSGKTALWQAAIDRAKNIYLTHISVFLLIFFVGFSGHFFLNAWKSNIFNFSDPLMFNNPRLALALGAMLLYQPTFLDILPLYFVFLLFTPLILEQFLKGHSATVLLSSVSLWLAAQFGALALFISLATKSLPIFLGGFDILAWQLLFVAGLYLGFLKHQGRELNFLLNNKTFLTSLIIALLLFLLRHQVINLSFIGFTDIETIISKERLGLFRLINFAVIVYLLVEVKSRFHKLLYWKPLAELGQHSLQVYTFHVAIIFLLAPVSFQISALPSVLGFFITFMIVLSLVIPAKLHQFYRDYLSNSSSEDDEPVSIGA